MDTPTPEQPLYLLTVYHTVHTHDIVMHLGIFRSVAAAHQAWTTLQKQGATFGGVDLRGTFPEIEVFRLNVLGGRVI